MTVLVNNVFSEPIFPGALYVAVSPSTFSNRMMWTAVTVQDRSRIEYSVRAWLDLSRNSSELWHWWPTYSLGWPSADNVKLVDELVTKWKSGKVYIADSILVERAMRQMRDKIVFAAKAKIGSTDWTVAATKGVYGAGTNKCSLFVHDVTAEAGADTGLTRGHMHPSPPSARDWATSGNAIPGWRALTANEKTAPGDVVAQSGNYSDATGHVMTIGPFASSGGLTFIGTSDAVTPEGIVVQIDAKPMLIDPPSAALGAEVFRRWDPLV